MPPGKITTEREMTPENERYYNEGFVEASRIGYAQVQRLRSLLEKCRDRLMHGPHCFMHADWMKPKEERQCTCGLSSLLDELDKELKP